MRWIDEDEQMIRTERRSSERLYERTLPGGGFVAIEVTPVRNVLGWRRYQGTWSSNAEGSATGATATGRRRSLTPEPPR
jgi:hypothetical protein